jgi:hypothetical protein
MAFSRFLLVICLALGVHALGEDELRWRKGTLADSGRPYWWRPTADSEDPEVTFIEPDDAWKMGRTDSGAPYLWRTTDNGKPEVQLWRMGYLDSGAPYWWRTTKGALQEVRLTNPFDQVGQALQGELQYLTHDEL